MSVNPARPPKRARRFTNNDKRAFSLNVVSCMRTMSQQGTAEHLGVSQSLVSSLFIAYYSFFSTGVKKKRKKKEKKIIFRVPPWTWILCDTWILCEKDADSVQSLFRVCTSSQYLNVLHMKGWRGSS